jgi:hypothetical protein
MLWLTLGLALLVHCGVEETITHLALEMPGPRDESRAVGSQVYFALCLTLLVLVWPVVLLEMVRGQHR